MFELDRIRRREPVPASIVLGALTLLVYGLECFLARGPSPGIEELLALGASEHGAVWTRNELWRLLCPVFLHASFAHIAMNGYSFFQLAPFIERIWGWSRFLVVYVVSGIAGAALSSRAGHAVSVGASGAIFGLMGFLLAAAYSGAHRYEVRTLVRSTWGQGLLISTGGVIAYGLTPGSGIDNYAHMGGLLAGAVLGLLLVETDADDRAMRAMGAGAVLAVLAAWVACGVDYSRRARFDRELDGATKALARSDYEGAADAIERALTLDPRDARVPYLLKMQGLAYLKGGALEKASYALERAWRNDPTPDVAALLVEVSVRRKDAKAIRSWAEALDQAAGREGLALLDSESRAAVASVVSAR